MKLIIDIPEEDYKTIIQRPKQCFVHWDIVDALRNGTPLDDVKGEWIEVVTEKFPNGEKRMWHYECSVCSTGEPPCPINKEHWDFCPNCGADMRGNV